MKAIDVQPGAGTGKQARASELPRLHRFSEHGGFVSTLKAAVYKITEELGIAEDMRKEWKTDYGKRVDEWMQKNFKEYCKTELDSVVKLFSPHKKASNMYCSQE